MSTYYLMNYPAQVLWTQASTCTEKMFDTVAESTADSTKAYLPGYCKDQSGT